MKIRYLIPIFTLAAIAIGTYFAIQYAKGYRPTTKGIAGTGLLAANSFPPGAQVYLNGKLTTATDDTVNLPPGDYEVTIKKDGFSSWTKNIKIQKELVAQTNATLFRAVPSLTPLTLSGSTNVTPSPDGQKIAYSVASASATAKNGLYVMELTSSPLSLQKGPRQIAKNVGNLNFQTAKLLWSPSSSQILAHFETKTGSANYLLEAGQMNDLDSLPDVSARLPLLLAQWEEEIVLRESRLLALLPEEMQQIATASATNVYFAPSEERIMYTSTEYAKLPEGIVKAPPAVNNQPEERELQPGGIYVYDLVDDRNFRIGSTSVKDLKVKKQLLTTQMYQQTNSIAATSTPRTLFDEVAQFNKLQSPQNFTETLNNFNAHYSALYVNGHQWFPDSAHILVKQSDSIEVIEYDGTNKLIVYSGPFVQNFAYPWPDGTKLIIITNLNPTSRLAAENLYAVDIR